MDGISLKCTILARMLAFLWITAVSTATTHGDAIHYCIPCESQYLQEIDISVRCSQVENVSSAIMATEFYGKVLPCVPCHPHFSSRNLTEICDELLSHTQTAETTQVQIAIPDEEECSLNDHKVLFEGTCKTLLVNSTCPEGEWLVFANETAKCVEQPCPYAQILFNGACVDGRDSSVCGQNQELVTYLDGSANCECDEDFAMDSLTSECYFRHTQGPCDETWFVEKMIDNQAACIPSLCSNISFVYIQGKCFEKQSPSPCSPEYFQPISNTTAACSPPLHSIFHGISLLSCPEGQRKTPSGCRDIFKLKRRRSQIKYQSYNF